MFESCLKKKRKLYNLRFFYSYTLLAAFLGITYGERRRISIF